MKQFSTPIIILAILGCSDQNFDQIDNQTKRKTRDNNRAIGQFCNEAYRIGYICEDRYRAYDSLNQTCEGHGETVSMICK